MCTKKIISSHMNSTKQSKTKRGSKIAKLQLRCECMVAKGGVRVRKRSVRKVFTAATMLRRANKKCKIIEIYKKNWSKIAESLQSLYMQRSVQRGASHC